MDADTQYISNIHDYCDSWCSRCEFTGRCRSFADELLLTVEESDDPLAETLEIVRDSLAEAKQMLIAKAEEMGIDLEEAMNDPAVDEALNRTRGTVESYDMFQLAHTYAIGSRHIFDRAADWLPPDDDPTTEEMLQVLHWYALFISAKIHRGLHGILDIDGYQDDAQLTDTQSDANGSIKVALIGLDRSLLAWKYLLTDANASVVRPEIDRLEEIKRLAEEKFPNAREFVRPGFDEIDVVM